MATKKKARKKPASSKPSKAKKTVKRAKKVVAKKSKRVAKTTAKKVSAKKSPAKKTASKKPAAKAAPLARKKAPGRAELQYSASQPEPRSGRLSGDLQGLSGRESADSESVDELLEEGNAFEAGVVSGVEDSGDDFEEVRTREVPEDDVPEEYLDDDK